MRNFTKIVLSLAMAFGLLGGVSSVSATTLNVDLSAITEIDAAASWNASTHTFGWTLTYSNAMTLPGIPSNMSNYTTVNWTATAGTMDHFRILIYYSNGAGQTTYAPTSDMTGTKSVTFADMGVVAANLAYISSIKISGANNGTGNIVISSFSFTGPDVVPIEASRINPTGTTELANLTGTYDGSSWPSSITYPKTVSNETIFCGDGDGSNEAKHVTITDYDYINFVVSEASADANTGLRIWIWNGSTVKTLYPHPIAEVASVNNWETNYYITAPGVYSVKVSDYDYLKGMKALQSWNGNAGTITISQVYLSTGATPVYSVEYSFIGKDNTSSTSMTAALADADATYYDATGLTGTGVTLNPTNPNALFKATAGQLSNTHNVIISDVCASLVLADGHPFKAPSDFTATGSSYGRAFTADKITTVCLPFALTAAEASSLGTFYELSSFDGATLHFSAVAAPEANKAYLVKTNATALTLSEADKSIVATPANLGTAITNVDFIGTMASTTIPASDGTNSYYAYNNGALVKIVTNAATLPAFRGYFKISTSAITTSARELTLSFDDDATGISQIETTRIVDNADAFDLQGRRVAQPTKGLYIVNGKKVIIK